MFDQIKIKNNHQKAKSNIAKAKFFQFINDDIIDRLEPVDKKFHKVLIINHNPEFIANIIKEKLPTKEITYCLDYQNLDYQTNYFDLIIFPFGFHWVEDIQKFLINVVTILHKEGIFFANFPGGGSLQHLRRILINLEAEAKRPHYAHISPFIQFNDITPLLQQAGFLEQIVDMEKLELEYDSPLKLMQAIKSAGEANALDKACAYSITRKIYQDLREMTANKFIDHINLITFLTSKTKNAIKLKANYFNPESIIVK